MWPGSVVSRKSPSDRGQPLGVLEVGEVRGAGQGLEAAVGDRVVGREAVRDRDRVVALAPDDQGGNLAEQVEAVAGADALAAGRRSPSAASAGRRGGPPGSCSGRSARAIACR